MRRIYCSRADSRACRSGLIILPMGSDREPDVSSRVGKAMVFAAWLLALGLLTLLFSDWQAEQANPNQELSSRITESGAREVTLDSNRHGHYVASGRINGQPVVFLLDTGATSVSIPDPVARDIGLERGLPYQVQTANGSVTVYATRLRQLALGDIVLEDVRAHINPRARGGQILLGMSALRHLELIQRDDQLTLRQYTQQ